MERTVTDQSFYIPDLSRRGRMASLEYGQAYNAARRANYALRRNALKTLQNCRALLSPAEIAVLDMVAGRRASIIGVARQTSRPIEDLWELYNSACEKLAIAFGHSNYFPKS
jgi:hypothetical protein